MREKAKNLLGDFQEVVDGWSSSFSWEPASTPDLWTFQVHPLKNLKRVIDHFPGFSSSATKTGPCTRIASETGRVRHVGLGIYPAPVVHGVS